MNVPFLDVRAAQDEVRAELDDAWRRVRDSGWYVLGAEVEAFEREWAAYCGARWCVGVGNGLDALELALRALDVGPGHEVIVPSNTYIATWLAITHAGAVVVPVEPDAATANIDPARVDDAITPRSRAILAVHLYGRTADATALRDVARRRGLALLEDAAQAHGARHAGRRAGALGDVAGWSFYPTKNLGALGDAGAVTTDDEAVADRVRVLRNYGSRRKYENEARGVNSRLDPLQAAFLRAKLRRLDDWTTRRRAVARRYAEALADTPDLLLPPPDDEACWHLYVVRHPRRDALRAHLLARGVETLVHYPIAPHRSGAYADAGFAPDAFPIARALADTVLSLPMGPHLSTEQQQRVVDAMRSFAG